MICVFVSFSIFVVFFSQFKEIFTFILSIVFIKLHSFFSEGSPNPTSIRSYDPYPALRMRCEQWILCADMMGVGLQPQGSNTHSPCPDPIYLLDQCSLSMHISAQLPYFWIPEPPDTPVTFSVTRWNAGVCTMQETACYCYCKFSFWTNAHVSVCIASTLVWVWGGGGG